MARFAVDVEVAAPPEQVWAALVDWARNGDWIPLTRMEVTSARPDGVGASFVGRTGIGPLRLVDPMVVTRWEPPAGGRPGRCTVRKTGTRVLGEATFEVAPVGTLRSFVRWEEDVQVAPVALTRPLAPLVSLAGWLSFRLALARFRRYVGSGRHARRQPA